MISGRRAIRQARIRNTTTGTTLAFAERQAEARNTNPTVVPLSGGKLSLATSDNIVLQVRHDANNSKGTGNQLFILAEEDATPTLGPSTWFNAHRVA